MNGRQSAFSISGHPVGQFLAMIVMGVVLVGAVIMGAFVFVVLLGMFVIGYSVFWLRAWWRWRKLRRRGPAGGRPAPGPAERHRLHRRRVRSPRGANADAARRRSGTGS